MSFLDDAISSIGQGLATTAVQEISQSTGVDVGGTLGFLFGGGQTAGGQNLASSFNSIKKMFNGNTQMLNQLNATLNRQGQAIAAIGDQLTGISTELATIEVGVSAIRAQLEAINRLELHQAWSIVNSQIVPLTSRVEAAYAQYADYISNYSVTPIALVDKLATSILDANVGPLAALNTISSFIIGGGGQAKGALELWSEMVAPLVQSSLLDYRSAVQQYFQYYQKLVYAQLRAVNLVMDAYTYYGAHTSVKDNWKMYKQQLLSQEDTFIEWLIQLIYSGQIGGRAKDGGHTPNFSYYETAIELNPGAQYMLGDADPGNAFYAPSTILKSAEQLLANLYVTGASDRRLVVHMLYTDGGNVPSQLDDLTLTVQDNSGNLVQAASKTRLGGPFPFPGGMRSTPDFNFFDGAGFYLKRYVYKEGATTGLLPNGSYSITDANDTIPSLAGYLGKAPFLQQSVIDYKMEINSISKFDFMNFLAFNNPQHYVEGWN